MLRLLAPSVSPASHSAHTRRELVSVRVHRLELLNLRRQPISPARGRPPRPCSHRLPLASTTRWVIERARTCLEVASARAGRSCRQPRARESWIFCLMHGVRMDGAVHAPKDGWLDLAAGSLELPVGLIHLVNSHARHREVHTNARIVEIERHNSPVCRELNSGWVPSNLTRLEVNGDAARCLGFVENCESCSRIRSQCVAAVNAVRTGGHFGLALVVGCSVSRNAVSEPVRVRMRYGVVSRVRVQVDPARQADRILRQQAPRQRSYNRFPEVVIPPVWIRALVPAWGATSRVGNQYARIGRRRLRSRGRPPSQSGLTTVGRIVAPLQCPGDSNSR